MTKKIEVERTRIYNGVEVIKMLDEQMKMVMECLPDKWLVLSHECIGTCDYRESETYNQCIDDFKYELKSKGLIK